MRSYRFARRSFLAGLGGAFGLEIMLRNLEAAAQGATSPARMLFMHYPIGTMGGAFKPSSTGALGTLPDMISPFEVIKSDTVVLYGHADRLNCPGGGGHEAGTPFTTTGANGAGTRSNGGQAAQVEVAGHRLDPRRGDADDRLGEVLVGEPDPLQVRAGGRALEALGQGARVVLGIEAGHGRRDTTTASPAAPPSIRSS